MTKLREPPASGARVLTGKVPIGRLAATCGAERRVFVNFSSLQKPGVKRNESKATYLPEAFYQDSRSPQRPAGEQNYGQPVDFLRLNETE